MPPIPWLEIWKDVVGYEGLYQVSNYGRVKSLGRREWHASKIRAPYWHTTPSRILRYSKDKRGYLQVTLTKDKVPLAFKVHKLVLEAFVGPKPEGMECCHSPDRDPSNCRLSNLRWDTHSNNYKDQILHGTSNHGMSYNVGENNGNARFTNEEVAKIRSMWESGYSQLNLSRIFKCGEATINRIVHRQGYK